MDASFLDPATDSRENRPIMPINILISNTLLIFNNVLLRNRLCWHVVRKLQEIPGEKMHEMHEL